MKRENLPELTLRGCLIAAFLTVILTAANVYFGLKSGLTFATSIPAAVISMSVLRFFKKSNILENCTVQTFASSAGTLTTIIFVLPALIMLGYWVNFSYWQTAFLCIIGGVLGVLFTVPLRRALIVESDLPYPEGVAAANILEIGAKVKNGENDIIKTDSRSIWRGTALSIIFSLFSTGFGILAETLGWFVNVGGAIFGFSMQYSTAVLGAGYLIGIRAGIGILIGIIISWGFIIPYFSGLETITDSASLSDIAHKIWSTKERFVGVGAMAVASVWTVVSLVPALVSGVASSMRDRRIQKNNKGSLPRTERDIPITWVAIISLLSIIPMFFLFRYFVINANLGLSATTEFSLVVLATLLVFIIGFVIAVICGYLAGIIGSSCAPMSGVSIIAILCSALLLVYFFNHFVPGYSVIDASKSLMAFGIFMGSFSIAIAGIANDNLQDLKTGQMVGATPWRQQVALLLGVTVGALVIPLIINLMYQAYGFVGSEMPRPGMDPKAALAAPQAAMMTELVRGIILQHGKWDLLAIGAIISSVFIAIDMLIFKPLNWPRLSALAVATGLYLPSDITMTLVVGSVISYLVKSRLRGKNAAEIEAKEQKGISFASGFILGETLLGILFASAIVFSSNSHPLSLVGDNFGFVASILGFVVFGIVCYNLYSHTISNKK